MTCDSASSITSHGKSDAMRIPVRLPDDLGEHVNCRTDNVSGCVAEALAEKGKIQHEERCRPFPHYRCASESERDVAADAS